MIVYRAEYEDGGGPFYYRNGKPRNPMMPDFSRYNDTQLYGADSLENLIKLISSYGFNINDFNIKQYITNDIISYNKKNGHVVFNHIDFSEVKE